MGLSYREFEGEVTATQFQKSYQTSNTTNKMRRSDTSKCTFCKSHISSRAGADDAQDFRCVYQDEKIVPRGDHDSIMMEDPYSPTGKSDRTVECNECGASLDLQLLYQNEYIATIESTNDSRGTTEQQEQEVSDSLEEFACALQHIQDENSQKLSVLTQNHDTCPQVKGSRTPDSGLSSLDTFSWGSQV